MAQKKKTPCLLVPFVALWDLIIYIVSLTGRLVAVLLGMVFLILGVILTSALAFLLYRRHRSRLLRILVSALVLFFALLYPLSSLISDLTQRNSVNALVQVGLIIYLFGLSLYSRLRPGQGQPAQGQAASA